MNFSKTIFGGIITAIGAGFGYLDYTLISAIYTSSIWVTHYLNALEALSIIIGLLLYLMFISLIAILGILALFLVVVGILIICDSTQSFEW